MLMPLSSALALFMVKTDLSKMQYGHDNGKWVSVLYCPQAQKIVELWVSLDAALLPALPNFPTSLTVQDVIIESGLLQCYPGLDLETPGSVGIWGRPATLNTLVQVSDRIEVYRPLTVDPKEARRLRYKKQGPIQSRHRPGYKGV